MARPMSHEEFVKFLSDQCQELDKYKWFLGERLQHDPLEDRTREEIYKEWVTNFASNYRKCWEESQGLK